MSAPDTLFLRLEGPLQAWGDTSKFVIRRSMDAPTKSGVLGMVCCAMGLSRAASREALPELNTLALGVRIDRPGTRWWDFHTVGAGIGMLTAAGRLKTGAPGTLITRREYLADASFLVALRGEAGLIERVCASLHSPRWQMFLGRKSCPPSVPVLARPRAGEAWSNPVVSDSLGDALASVPWCPRCEHDHEPTEIETLIEWRPEREGDLAPHQAEVWYDAPVSFDPPVHEPRLVLRGILATGAGVPVGEPTKLRSPARLRPRAEYGNAEYKKRRVARIEADTGLCVFCKGPGTTVQHVTYRRAGGEELPEDLRTLCRLCHDAVTMLEYGAGMGLDRIDPCEPRWRDGILRARGRIIEFRSEEGRRRALRTGQDPVHSEVLEEGEV